MHRYAWLVVHRPHTVLLVVFCIPAPPLACDSGRTFTLRIGRMLVLMVNHLVLLVAVQLCQTCHR